MTEEKSNFDKAIEQYVAENDAFAKAELARGFALGRMAGLKEALEAIKQAGGDGTVITDKIVKLA